MPDHSQFDTDPHLSGPDDHLQQPADQHVLLPIVGLGKPEGPREIKDKEIQ